MNPRAKRIVAAGAGVLMATGAATASLAAPASAEAKPPKALTSTIEFDVSKAKAETKDMKALLDKLYKAKPAPLPPRKLSGAKLGKNLGSPDANPGAIPGTPRGTAEPGKAGDETGSFEEDRLVNPPMSSGKMFIQDENGNFFACSGTGIVSRYHNIVSTAGHCVINPKTGKPYPVAIFIPQYYRDRINPNAGLGSRRALPAGAWALKSVKVHKNWRTRQHLDFDYAFGAAWEINADYDGDGEVDYKGKPPVDGKGRVQDGFTPRKLGKVVGEQGLTWNREGFEGFFWAYPQDPFEDGTAPFMGERPKWCYGPDKKAPKFRTATNHWGLKCRFTGGASGGGAMQAYKNKPRYGYLNGIMSLAWDFGKPPGRPDFTSTPYFDGQTYQVYKRAANNKAAVLRRQ